MEMPLSDLFRFTEAVGKLVEQENKPGES